MGADIYLHSVYDKNHAKWEPLFNAAVIKRNTLPDGADTAAAQKKVSEIYSKMYAEGYFRDSYNGTALFAVLGLSWWKDVIPMLDDKSNLPIPKAKELRAIVEKAKIPKMTKACLKEMRCKIDDEDTVESWEAYFANKKARFIALLDQSIELNEPLSCSL